MDRFKQHLRTTCLIVAGAGCFTTLIFMVLFPFNLSPPPKVGDAAAEVQATFGTPGAVHKPGQEVIVHGEPWFEVGNDEKLKPTELPEITDERWFYATGFGGTTKLLVYIENGLVRKVYWHRS